MCPVFRSWSLSRAVLTVVFLAKTRLIKSLHQEMGFDVLASEHGLFAMRKAWQAMAEGDDPGDALSTGVFRIWANSAEVQPLISYLGEEAHNYGLLELAGFDCQFSDAGSRTYLVSDLESFLDSEGCPLLADDRWPAMRETLTGLIDGTQYKERPSEEDRQQVMDGMFFNRVLERSTSAEPPGTPSDEESRTGG